jgi:hypothetical protein
MYKISADFLPQWTFMSNYLFCCIANWKLRGRKIKQTVQRSTDEFEVVGTDSFVDIELP